MKEYNANGEIFIADGLKKCPFCGGQAEVFFAGNEYTPSIKIEIKCMNCGVEYQQKAKYTSFEWLFNKMLKKWNYRV